MSIVQETSNRTWITVHLNTYKDFLKALKKSFSLHLVVRLFPFISTLSVGERCREQKKVEKKEGKKTEGKRREGKEVEGEKEISFR